MSESGRGIVAARTPYNDDQCSFPDRQDASWYRPSTIDAAPQLRSELARTIETEIIPRLLVAHRTAEVARSKAPASSPIAIGDEDIAAFAEMIVHQPLGAARARLDGLRERGLTAEELITTVLSRTARYLGLLWEEDRCTFVDVTVGLSRLQQLLRIYGPAFETAQAPEVERGSVLLAVVPGEQHTFGLAVVEEFLRRAGWHVHSDFLPSKAVLLEQVRTGWFDVVGLSASGEVTAAGVAALVEAVRTASLNKGVKVLLGGRLFLDDPGLALSLGADVVACDAADAVNYLDWLCDAKKISC